MKTMESILSGFKKILLATDFSRVSEKALPYTAAMARHFGATIYVAHVVSKGNYAHIPDTERGIALAEMKQKAERQIEAVLATSHFEGIPRRIILDHGDVLPVLSRIVEKNKIGLVVTGTHGKHGLQKLLSGSMAEEIFRLGNVPVLAVGPEVEPQAEVPIRRILYVSDFSAESKRGLQYACALVKEYGASLYFLHVVENAWGEPMSTRFAADDYCRLQLCKGGLWEILRAVRPEFFVEFGSTEELTLQVARKRHVQIIVLNVSKTTYPLLSAHFPGPIAYNVVSHAPCPVLGVRGDEDC